MNWRPIHHRREAAHSLPEAIIAALVIGMMVVSLYAGFSSGFAILQSTREDLRATQILLDRVESLRLYSWTQLLDTNKYLMPTFTELYDPVGLSNQTSGVIYSGTISAKAPGTNTLGSVSYRSNMLQLTVKVYWTNYAAGQEVIRSRQLQTFVARYGMQNYIQ